MAIRYQKKSGKIQIPDFFTIFRGNVVHSVPLHKFDTKALTSFYMRFSNEFSLLKCKLKVELTRRFEVRGQKVK